MSKACVGFQQQLELIHKFSSSTKNVKFLIRMQGQL